MHNSKIYLAKLFTMIGLILSCPILSVFGASQHDNSYDLSVPVYVITDRNLTKYASNKSLSDPALLVQYIRAGIVNVPVRVKTVRPLDVSALQNWGCTIKNRFYPERISRDSIESQLTQWPATMVTIGPGNLNPLAGLDSFIEKLNSQIVKSPQNELLIFVHGCCEGPQDSYEEAAQLSVQCNSPVLLFDWASPSVRQAGFWSYIQSDRALEVSEIYFGKLIEHLRDKTSSKHVSLVAFSMGSKLVRNYLRQFPDSFIDQVHLVRPDISLPVFLMEQDKFKNQFGQMYIYVSAHDLALQSSALLMSSNVERLGMQHDPSLWFAKQLDNAPANTTVIDTSNLHLEYDVIGHRIPFEAIGYMNGLENDKTISSFEIERPFSTNPHFCKLRYKPAGI